jgi:hypothetical protein
MRFVLAALLTVLMVPAQAGSLRHYPGLLLPPLYGGGYTPLDCAATVFPPPRWCRWGSHRLVLRARAHRCLPCRGVGRRTR